MRVCVYVTSNVWKVNHLQLTMLVTTELSSPSTLKSGCQLPGLPLQVSASTQMEPPAVTCPVYITHLRSSRARRAAGDGLGLLAAAVDVCVCTYVRRRQMEWQKNYVLLCARGVVHLEEATSHPV